MITLGSHNLVVVVSNGKAGIGPRAEMAAGVHFAARTLLPTNRPVLLESLVAIDAGRVVAGRPANVIGAVVAVHLAEGLGVGRGVVGAEVLDNVVLDEGVPHPAVDSEVAVAVRLVVTRVFDAPVQLLGVPMFTSVCLLLKRVSYSPFSQTRVPSLAADKVAPRLPLNAVAATSEVGVSGRRRAVGPPRIEVSVVGALRVGRVLALLEGECLVCLSCGGGQGSDARQSDG